MKIPNSLLAASLLLAFVGAPQSSQGAPRAKPAPKQSVPQALTPTQIENLRKKAEQTRARVRRQRALDRERDAELVAPVRRMNLSEEDWRGLFRSSETSRQTIVPLLDKLPVSVSEQGYNPKIKPWLSDVYKTIAPQMAPRSNGGTLAIFQDRLALQTIALQCKVIELALLHLKADLGEHNALLPKVDASLLAIRDTQKQAQLLIDRMASGSSKTSQTGLLLAYTHCDQTASMRK